MHNWILSRDLSLILLTGRGRTLVTISESRNDTDAYDDTTLKQQMNNVLSLTASSHLRVVLFAFAGIASITELNEENEARHFHVQCTKCTSIIIV